MTLSRLSIAATLIAAATSTGAFAQLTTYSQDFEALDIASPTAVGDDGWLGFANVFDPAGNYLYGYGTFPAPNGGPGFSALAGGLGGAMQGAQHLNVYSDYNNGDHANGNYIDALVFQEQPIDAANIGQTWRMSFDYLKNPVPVNGDGDSTTFAFVKVIKVSDMSFATLAEVEFETTGASDTMWNSSMIDLLIDPTFAGEVVQFGFRSYATNYLDTSRIYDNVAFEQQGGSPPQLAPYTQDFEALDILSPTAVGDDGWLGFANVFDPAGNYLYGYGTFPAPNGGPGFSAISDAFGGMEQGAQQLSIYSDYNNGDHANGNYIDALVFQEQPIGAANVGQNWRFSFDYLKNPIPVNGDADSTTFAFIKVIKVSDMSFATLAEQEFETTNASDTTWADSALDLLIDPTFAGEVVQFGFRSYATNYNDTSRIYDNVVFDEFVAGPSLTEYTQDFEALDINSPTALGGDGWKVFANVFDPAGNRLYGYGVFDAPNGGPGFSAIGTGDGGPFQGQQYINVYSDYNNGDHANGNYIEALVFQEQPVGGVNVGETWRLEFDFRRNPLVVNGEGDSTMFAFIKVLESSTGSFATLAEVEREVTGASPDAWARSAIDLLIDPAHEGELLQFGFRSYATNYNDTGRYYDNLRFSQNATPGLGDVVCLGNRNSTGDGALLTITGSDVAADNDLTLSVTGLPQNAMGYFAHSLATNFVYNPGGSDGHLCIASLNIGRFAGNVLNSGASGEVSFSPDLTALPTPMGTVPALAGETRYFQYWTRDMMGASNFSSASGVTFQ